MIELSSPPPRTLPLTKTRLSSCSSEAYCWIPLSNIITVMESVSSSTVKSIIGFPFLVTFLLISVMTPYMQTLELFSYMEFSFRISSISIAPCLLAVSLISDAGCPETYIPVASFQICIFQENHILEVHPS